MTKKIDLNLEDFFFQENYQRACDKLCEALQESGNYRGDLVRIEFVPDPYVEGEPFQAICHFKNVRATVNIRDDNVWAMYKDILRHLDAVANREKDWG